MKPNSLATRLFMTAAVWTIIVLPIAGLIIHGLYRREILASFDSRLQVLLTVVLADSIDHGGTEPGSPKDVGEPLFELAHSGWYWQITPLDGVPGRRLVSASLASERLVMPNEQNLKVDDAGIRWTTATGPLGEPLRVAEIVHTTSDDATAPRYSYVVAGTLAVPERSIAAFRYRLTVALALTGLGLLLVTWLQVHFGLNPLKRIEKGLAAIRSGDAHNLEGELPAEIEPLQSELNALIKSNEEIVERARTQVGNLAHALKTPLAVIINEARDDKSPFSRKVAEQAGLMQSQITTYLERARMAARAGGIGRVTEVKPVVESIVRAVERIHRERQLTFTVECPEGCRFQGEKQDLEEMLGNLLDNAGKWARSAVRLSCTLDDGTETRRQVVIAVDDDGPGLTSEQRAQGVKRGRRLDESKPGTGLGLSIVADFAQSYRGRFELEESDLGGLSARLTLPAV